VILETTQKPKEALELNKKVTKMRYLRSSHPNKALDDRKMKGFTFFIAPIDTLLLSVRS